MHGAKVSRHQPVCEVPGLLSRFYFFFFFFFFFFFLLLLLLLLLLFNQDVFYNPENENELLASMDIDHPVRIQGKKKKKRSINNTVIESEVPKKVATKTQSQVENENKQRFANMSTAEIDEITSKAETKNTKDNIKWTSQVLERKMQKCYKRKNSVKRSRKRSLAIFSYKKIKQSVEKTENLISYRIHKYISL